MLNRKRKISFTGLFVVVLIMSVAAIVNASGAV